MYDFLNLFGTSCYPHGFPDNIIASSCNFGNNEWSFCLPKGNVSIVNGLVNSQS